MKSILRETRSIREFALGVGSLLAIAGCGEFNDGTSTESSADDASPAQPEPDSPHARGVIERVRALHQVRRPARFDRPGLLASTTPSTTPSQKAVLGPSVGARFERAQQRLLAKWTKEAPVEVWVPVRSVDAFGLRDRESGLAVEATLVGARDRDAAAAEGIAVYEGAGPSGGTVIHRLTDAGTEDYVTFETRPEVGQISYDLSLSDVAGLRLVSNTLEFVDGAGSPRLRISPPYVVGGRGEVVEAALSLSGCAADHDPSAPWDRPPVAPGSDRCRVDVRWDVDSVSYPAIVDPSWGSTTRMSVGRVGFVAAPLANNNVLVSGGLSPTFTVLDTADLYNVINRMWSVTNRMREPRAYHAAAPRGGSAAGQVLVAGGFNASGDLRSAETYTPSGGWTIRDPMSVARSMHQLTTLNNGDVLVSGGNVDSTLGAQRFTVSNSTWIGAGSMLSTTSSSQHTATLLADGRVLVVGETQHAGQLFNPSANMWSQTKNTSGTLPERRSGHAAARLSNGNVVIAGGYTVDGGLSAEVFNPSTNQWSRTGNLWQQHRSPQFGSLGNGRMLIAGDSNDNPRTNAEIFDFAAGTWRPGPVLPAGAPARHEAVSVAFPSGLVLVAGGRDTAGNILDSAIEFNPNTPALTVIDKEYRLTAAADAEVINVPDHKIEIWASVYRPNPLPAGRLPLVVFLHGNHGTCGSTDPNQIPRLDERDDYTTTGTCPSGYSVVKSHRGYDYIAKELASRNYLVVSINANRGINYINATPPTVPGDPQLIGVRGRLILKHLQKLSEWNRTQNATPPSLEFSLFDKIDFTQVGLMGHSMGGEGARSAYNQYRAGGSPWQGRIGPVSFRGIFEIAPTDHLGTQDAIGTNRSVLLPMCDGELTDLPGVKSFDRMLRLPVTDNMPKSTYTVWGANHSYYNTEWQKCDAIGPNCEGSGNRQMFSCNTSTGSAEQRQSGFQPMLAFFLANVGNAAAPADPWFNNLFNSNFSWPTRPRVDRGYTPGLGATFTRTLEDFLRPTGTGTFGVPNSATPMGQIFVTHKILPEHASEMQGADIAWASSAAVFQTNMFPVGSGISLQSYNFLDFRVDRAADDRNVGPSTEFLVQLVDANDTPSFAVLSSFYVSLTGPVGGPGLFGRGQEGLHSMLQTVRIPLTAFGANLSAIRGVRFSFSVPGSSSGRIFLANIRAAR